VNYEEGASMVFKQTSVADFIESDDPVTMLGLYNKFVFDDKSKKYEERPETNAEIKACIADLKVLNKKDFRGILKWRQRLIAYFKAQAEKEAEGSDEEGEEDGEDGSGDDTKDLTPEEIEALRMGEVR